MKYAIPTYYTIADAEASSNLERFDGVKYGYRAESAEELHAMYKQTRSEGFGPEVKRRIMLGSFVLSSGYYDAYYLKALKVKSTDQKAFDEAFAKYDMILGPCCTDNSTKAWTESFLIRSRCILVIFIRFQSILQDCPVSAFRAEQMHRDCRSVCS